jgi:hypothetical protein
MKCYFDGSQTVLPNGHLWLTLAGYMGSDFFWEGFKWGWKTEVLEKDEPHAPYLHATEIISGNGAFDGWDRERRNRLLLDAVQYLQSLPKKGFCAMVCGIDATEAKALADEGYDIQSPYYICGHWCIMKAFTWYYDVRPEGLEPARIYFDQGEKFMHPFRQKWEREMKTQKRVINNSFWGLIEDVSSLDMRTTPPLQAADLIAWAESRQRSSVEERPWRNLAKMIEPVLPSWRAELTGEYLRMKHSAKARA